MKKILYSVFVLLVSYVSNAQWNGDPAVGTLVSTGSSTLTKSDIVSVSDGVGGAYIAWIEAQSSTASKIFIQRLLADGTRAFSADAIVSESSGAVSARKTNLAMTPDGAGGVICVWQDERFRLTISSGRDEIYGQRISATGARLWDTAGVRVTVADITTSSKISPVVTMVNNTEAILVFGDNRLGNSDLFAQKINIANGLPQWITDVSLHGNQAGTSTFQNVLPDGLGGAFIVWQDPRLTNNADVYGQRIDNAGVIQWASSGTPIANTVGNHFQPSAVLDGAGGIVVTYQDFLVAGGTDPNIYAQRINNLGAKMWNVGATPQEGVAVCVAPLIQSNPYVVKSGSNFIFAWGDQRIGGTGIRDIYAQSLDLSGALQWPNPTTPAADGINVVNAVGNQPSSSPQSGYQIVSDNAGGAVIVWDDARGTDLDIYAQRISSAGLLQWPTVNGVPVSTAIGAQQTPVVVPNSVGGYIVAWRDGRSGTANTQIFAARLQSTGVLPVRSININAVTKINSVDIKWNTIDEENVNVFIVEKSTDGINFSAIGSVKAKGTGDGSYVLEDVRPVKGFNYYRVKAVDINRAFRYSSVVSAQLSNNSKASMVIYPNPIQGSATLQLVNLDAGPYQLKVRDLSGRTVLQKTITMASNYMVLDLQLQQISAGSYFVQLESAQRIVLSSAIQKQ